MKTITIRIDEKLYERVQKFVHYHGQLSHLVRRWIVEGLRNEDENKQRNA